MNKDIEAMKALIGQIQAGDTQAVEELARTIADPIRCEVCRHLSAREQHTFDPDDIKQDVLLSIWMVVRKGKCFEDPPCLTAYLKATVENKLHKVHRYYHQQRRDIDREVRLDEEAGTPELAARQPPLGDELAVEDEWERWLEKQPSDLREIAMALRRGQTLAEIALACGVSVKTICRAREKIRQSLSSIYPPQSHNNNKPS